MTFDLRHSFSHFLIESLLFSLAHVHTYVPKKKRQQQFLRRTHTHREKTPISRYTLTRAKIHSIREHNHNNNNITAAAAAATKIIVTHEQLKKCSKNQAQKKETNFTHALTNFRFVTYGYSFFSSILPVFIHMRRKIEKKKLSPNKKTKSVTTFFFVCISLAICFSLFCVTSFYESLEMIHETASIICAITFCHF